MSNLQMFPVRVVRDTKTNKMVKKPSTGGKSWIDYETTQEELKNSKNLGIVIPSGVIVIDLDTHKGVTKTDVDFVLDSELNWDEAELQFTPSGGAHYGFLVPDNMELRQGSDLLGLTGFDTRTSGKGWIATGEGYEDRTMLGLPDAIIERDLPQLPSEAITKLTQVQRDDSDDLAVMVAAQPLDDLTVEDIGVYLERLPVEERDSYDSWLNTGMALFHQSEGEKWGFDLFVDYSRDSSTFDVEEIKAKWRSFKKGGGRSNPVTFASVIKRAGGKVVLTEAKTVSLQERINGLEDKEELAEVITEVAGLKLSADVMITIVNDISIVSKKLGLNYTKAEVKKILKQAKATQVIKDAKPFYDDYVFMTRSDEYLNRETKGCMKTHAFDVAHGRDTPPNADGETQKATTYINNRIEVVDYSMYAPQFPDVFHYQGVKYINTYIENVVKPVERKTNIVERVKGHIDHLLTGEKEREILTSYLAHNAQFPGKQIHWAMVLQGVQGDGKTFFYELMKNVLGYNNCKTINVEQLEEKFTKWSEGACMVFIEELKLDNYRKYEILNKLKPYITNPTVSVRKMQTDSYEAVNTTNYFALTNFKDAIPIDENDRRYCVLFSQWQNRAQLLDWMAQNEGYYPELYADMRDNWQEVYEWLKAYEIPSWFMNARTAPTTSAKNSMIDMSKSDEYFIVQDAIEKFECSDINSDLVNVTKLQNMVDQEFDNQYRNFPKTTRLKHILSDMGYHHAGRYRTRKISNQLIYAKDAGTTAIDFKDVITAF